MGNQLGNNNHSNSHSYQSQHGQQHSRSEIAPPQFCQNGYFRMMEALDYYGSDKARIDLHHREKMIKTITMSLQIENNANNTTLNSTSNNINLSNTSYERANKVFYQFQDIDNGRVVLGRDNNLSMTKTIIEQDNSLALLRSTTGAKERNKSEFDLNQIMNSKEEFGQRFGTQSLADRSRKYTSYDINEINGQRYGYQKSTTSTFHHKFGMKNTKVRNIGSAERTPASNSAIGNTARRQKLLTNLGISNQGQPHSGGKIRKREQFRISGLGQDNANHLEQELVCDDHFDRTFSVPDSDTNFGSLFSSNFKKSNLKSSHIVQTGNGEPSSLFIQETKLENQAFTLPNELSTNYHIDNGQTLATPGDDKLYDLQIDQELKKSRAISIAFDQLSESAENKFIEIKQIAKESSARRQTSSNCLPFETKFDLDIQKQKALELRQNEGTEDVLNVDFKIDEEENVAEIDPSIIENVNDQQGADISVLGQQDPQKLRMKYLQRLTNEQIWLPPMKQPKPSQNIIIFDWDDTLFPTTHLNPIDDSMYDSLFERYKTQLGEIEDQAIKLINACLKESKKGWVEFSSSKFMPTLHTLVMKYVRIISARVDFEDMYPYDTFKWKEMAFLRLWEEEQYLDKASITNLIAVGDAEYEMEAAKNFASKSDRCLIKLVKLRECPSFEELRKELGVVNEKYDYIFSSFKNLTIKLERVKPQN